MSPRILPQRVLLAKVGLDGHDRGIKVVARGLRDAGFHVIYSGLWQSVESVARAAGDEDIDWLGVSILNGAQMTLVPALLEALHRRDLVDVGVIVGGIIPEADQQRLKALGVIECFGPGTNLEQIVEFLRTCRQQLPGYGGESQCDDFPALVRCVKQGNRPALARLLTCISSGSCDEILEEAIGDQASGSVAVVAVTGSAGVGKSSLLGALVTCLSNRGKRVGVLACDPQSPVTSGALLGDRCRIAGTETSDRIFIRSLPTASGQQGVAPRLGMMIHVMRLYGGFDRIFVETVGAGQGDVAVRDLADIVVLVVQPLTGDALQWEKAGILELADVVVINKSDLHGADHTVADIIEQLGLTGVRRGKVVKTSVARGEGFDALDRAIEHALASSGSPSS